jgi:hypothetical protein
MMDRKSDPIGRGRSRTGNFLIYLVGILLAGSASAKVAHVPMVVAQLGAMGFEGGRLMVVALLELASAALLLIPTTRSAGLLMASSFLGGAIATHLGHGQPMVQPVFVLALLWLGMWLRHPEILWSLSRSRQSPNPLPQR